MNFDEKIKTSDARTAQNKLHTTRNVTVPSDHDMHGWFASFWSNFEKKENIKIEDGSPQGRQMSKVVKDLLARIYIAKTREPTPVSLSHSFTPDLQLCSELILVVILNIIHQVGEAFKLCSIEVMITRLSNIIKGEKKHSSSGLPCN